LAKSKTKEQADAAAGIDPAKDHISVRSTAAKGHLRAGMRHANVAKVHPPGTFDAAQLQQLADDPRIIVAKADAPEGADAQS
jgi:hypothetical protein